MSMLAAPDTITGPLTAADLDRDTNTGRIYRLHRIHCEPGAIVSDDDCEAMVQFCAPEGGQFADPVPSALSMRRHHNTRATVGLAVAIAVVGYLAHIAWPLLG